MADFRKWLFAFAVVALLLGTGTASAQSNQAFTCVANAGAPVIVRVEGITELVGDLLLQCTGGNPTPAGQQVPVTNIRLTLNTNITSRLLGSGFIDSLLLIDEPYPNDSNTPQNTHPGPGDANSQAFTGVGGAGTVGNVTVPPNSPYQVLCSPRTSPTTGIPGTATTAAVPGSCNYLLGTYTGAASTARGNPGSPYLQLAAPTMLAPSTVYVAQQVAANAVEWDGVPIDAPGTTGNRIVRMTNVRANACQLGLSSTLIPTQIVGFVSVTGAQLFTINNPQQTLAYIQQGLVTSSTNNTASQCVNLNTGGGGVGGNISGSGNTIAAVSRVVVTEGFAQSFKAAQFSSDKLITGTGGVGASSSPLANNFIFYNVAPQNVPGYAYNTESGFQPTSPNGSTYLNNALGTANTGTRILLRFSNVQNGASVILPGVVPLTVNGSSTLAGNPNPPSSVGGWSGGYLVLLGTSDLSGNVGSFSSIFSQVNNFTFNSPFFSTSPFRGPGFGAGSIPAPFNTAFSVASTAGAAAAVYEVVNADPSATETASIAVGVSFVSNTSNNLPTPGQATVSASFAPLSTNNVASSGDVIPRFCDRSTAANAFNIAICSCNLLFPFVTQAPGFDTGIAIANTTTDPYGTAPQTGTVTMYFYGQTSGGGALPTALQKQVTTGNVPSGQVMTFTAFGGAGAFAAGLQPVPGFTGYMIAIANFQLCHGFAFISDLGAQRLAEGYIAIQLDTPTWSACGAAGVACTRTGVVGEDQGR